MKRAALLSLIFIVLFLIACIHSPSGKYRNVTIPTDIIVIEKIEDNEYKLIRGDILPGSETMANRKELKIKIDGTIMNYRGQNFDAFKDHFSTLEFKEGTFKKID